MLYADHYKPYQVNELNKYISMNSFEDKALHIAVEYRLWEKTK